MYVCVRECVGKIVALMILSHREKGADCRSRWWYMSLLLVLEMTNTGKQKRQCVYFYERAFETMAVMTEPKNSMITDVTLSHSSTASAVSIVCSNHGKHFYSELTNSSESLSFDIRLVCRHQIFHLVHQYVFLLKWPQWFLDNVQKSRVGKLIYRSIVVEGSKIVPSMFIFSRNCSTSHPSIFSSSFQMQIPQLQCIGNLSIWNEKWKEISSERILLVHIYLFLLCCGAHSMARNCYSECVRMGTTHTLAHEMI